MALSEARIHRGRATPYPWERHALDWIYGALEDCDPHQAWELHELHDPTNGRLYDLDLLFLSRQGLFLVEIKSHPGVLTGDIVDWTFTEGEKQRRLRCPYPGVNLKAKVLADRLRTLLGKEIPFVQPVVFLSQASEVRLAEGRPPWLLLPEDVGDKLANGLDGRPAKRPVDASMMERLLQAAREIGLRAASTAREVGGYRLAGLLDEGAGYQEHLAENAAVAGDRVRVRSYLVPAATSSERRAELREAAQREALALAKIGEHPGILTYRSFVEDGPLGPALLFEPFEGAFPLHDFLRQEPSLSVDERFGLLKQIVEALAHCHRAGILHRNLSPSAVLVRRGADGRMQVRLHRFHAASGVHHGEAAGSGPSEAERLYQAPEVLADPSRAAIESDVFSVGCLAWLIFTGQPPAATVEEREARLRRDGGLRPAGRQATLAALEDALRFATDPSPVNRAHDLSDWFSSFVMEAYGQQARALEAKAPRIGKRTLWGAAGVAALLALALHFFVQDQREFGGRSKVLQAGAAFGMLETSCENPIDWKRARFHIGEERSVAGPLIRVTQREKVRGSPIYLDVGQAFPEQERLALVVWKRHQAGFSLPELRALVGREVCVTGEIRDYEGTPQIQLKDPQQIRALR